MNTLKKKQKKQFGCIWDSLETDEKLKSRIGNLN